MNGANSVKGVFVTIEGPDGAGKTSVISQLEKLLKNELIGSLLLTREPGGIPISEEIRQVILNPQNVEMDERTEALLYAAARRQHLIQRIIPAMETGTFVLCDRFVDSSLAYQGVGREIGIEPVRMINDFATEGYTPDLTLYLDIDVETGLARIAKGRNKEDLDRLDQESLGFHQRVQRAYLKIAEQNSERIVKINASHSLEQVVADCLSVIKERFPTKFNLTK